MNPIDEKVFNGISKTINRFREKPFHYFTEADIHSSLLNDMMSGGSDVMAHRPVDPIMHHISVSLIHQEYPTNFRYRKEDMISGYDDLQITELGFVDEKDKTFGDRGNYDLAVMNPEFAVRMLENNPLQEALEHLINKDNQRAISRKTVSHEDFKRELLYAIEVKFIHPFNARNKNMLDEIIKYDNKLKIAYKNSGGFVRPINLVFCSTESKIRSDNKQSVVQIAKEYIEKMTVTGYDGTDIHKTPEVVTIFIESYLNQNDLQKLTVKPVISGGIGNWVLELKDILRIK